MAMGPPLFPSSGRAGCQRFPIDWNLHGVSPQLRHHLPNLLSMKERERSALTSPIYSAPTNRSAFQRERDGKSFRATPWAPSAIFLEGCRAYDIMETGNEVTITLFTYIKDSVLLWRLLMLKIALKMSACMLINHLPTGANLTFFTYFLN